MPYPSQVNPEQILNTAVEMIEQYGVESLSLSKLADALGVKAPSLYRYYNGKAALLRTVNTVTRKSINADVVKAANEAGDNPRDRMVAMAKAYRLSALQRPAAYGLAYTNTIDDMRVSEEALNEIWAPLWPITAAFAGEEDARTCITGLWTISHGYVMLEICRNLRHEAEDNEAVYLRIVDAYLDGWE